MLFHIPDELNAKSVIILPIRFQTETTVFEIIKILQFLDSRMSSTFFAFTKSV